MSEFPIHDRGVQGDLTPSVALEGESGSAGSGSPSSSAAHTEPRFEVRKLGYSVRPWRIVEAANAQPVEQRRNTSG